MADRNHDLERWLLRGAGGLPTYADQVLARLDHYEEDDGGNSAGWDQDLDQLLVEAQEEAADISGWLLGAAQQLHPAFHGRLVVAMRLAAVVHRELEELRILLARDADSDAPQ
jgi:hypothetical protein